ncbi:MAG: hypothetical protein ACTSVA_09380 [Candidatus Njordarchaeales archaeon]
MPIRIPHSNSEIRLLPTTILICRCSREGKENALIFNTRLGKYEYKGNCYSFCICALIAKSKFEIWLKNNERLIKKESSISTNKE